MKASLKELCDQNPTLNTDDLTLEKALLPNFDSLVSCSYLSAYLKVLSLKVCSQHFVDISNKLPFLKPKVTLED